MELKDLRKSLNKWFVVGILGLIIITFIFVGGLPTASQFLGPSPTTAIAEVGGEKITLASFQRALSQRMQIYRSLGSNIPPSMLANVSNQVLESLIQNEMLKLEAKRIGIGVSSQEVMDEVKKIIVDAANRQVKEEKDKQKFSVELYKNLMKANNMETGVFEAQIRDSLIQQKMMQFFEKRVQITNDEVRREFELNNDKRNLEFVQIKREDAYPKMTVNTAEIDTYLKDEAKFNLVKNHYNTNIRKYKRGDKVCARHILKRVEEKEAKVAPKEFAALNPTIGNFAELAKKHSEDPGSKPKGGDLGCFEKEQMVKEFADTAFAMEPGNISKPIKSQFGWHYIYVYKKEKGFHKQLDTVKKDIATDLLKQDRFSEIMQINRKTAENIAGSWSSGFKPSKDKLKETGMFSRLGSFIPGIGRAEEIMNAAFDDVAKVQKEPQIFEALGGVIVAKVKEKEMPNFDDFEKNKKTQLSSLRARKMRAFQNGWIKHIRESYKVSRNTKLLEKIAQR